MKKDKSDLLQGTLDLLILKTLKMGPKHGWAISESIQSVSLEALKIKEGSLYPALHRLEKQKFVKAEWGLSENNRKAKYYSLTTKGQRQFAAESEYWESFVSSVKLVLEG